MSTTTRTSRAARWAGYIAFATLFAIACWWLSQWQFDRNTGRETEIALIEANYDATPVPFERVVDVSDALLPTAAEWRQVTLEGSYAEGDPIFVRNRPHGGSNAFEVLHPFRLSDGTIIIVNRGWVPPGTTAQPSLFPAPPLGHVTVTGHIMPSEAPVRAGRGADPGQVANIDLRAVAELSGPETFVGAYVRAASEQPAASVVIGGFEPPSTDSGPHLSYAIQWILFAIMGFGFIGYVIRTEVHNHREGRDLSADRRTKRRDRDADYEDALLDG